MPIYQFDLWNKKFVVDIESGNYFEVDALASKALSFLQKHPPSDIPNLLSKEYPIDKINQTLQNLENLKEEGFIFTHPTTCPEKKIKRKITDLTLNIVNDCNISCRYCWNAQGGYGQKEKQLKKMDEKVLKKAIDVLLKESSGSDDVVVDFYGGEPLLNIGLIRKTIDICEEIRNQKNINFRYLLATNGTLMTQEVGEFLIRNGVDVAVSLDGEKSIQDKQRPFSDGTGTFDTIMKNLNSLKKEYRQRIVGRATFTPHSQDILKTFNFLRSLDFDRIELCESEKAGYGLDNNDFFFSGPEGIKTLKKLYNELALFYVDEILKGTLTYENTYFNRFFKQLSRLYHIHSIVGSCSAGFTLMAVDMDGSIYPCTAFVGLEQFKIGDVDRGIDDKKLDSFTNNKAANNASCQKCWAKKLCKGCGSCYNLNFFSHKNLTQPDAYHCELFRYKTKLMIAMISVIAEKNSDRLDEVLIPEYYATRGKTKA